MTIPRHVGQRFLGALAACTFSATAVAQTSAPARMAVRAENPLPIERRDETISVAWGSLREQLPSVEPARVRVLGGPDRREIASQVVDINADGRPEELLFQASFWPGETKAFVIEAVAPSGVATPRVHVKFVPDRTDVAWESDRIAFRTYGQLLWQLENLHSSGVDVWVKRTRELVLDRWYAKGHDAYHLDIGEGADFYKVGPTLGSGGTAIWRDGKLYRAENFARHRIIATGPIRAIFELDFDAWDAGGVRVTETKRISIDAGSNLYRQESMFRTEGSVGTASAPLTYAVGTVKRPKLIGSMSAARAWAWLGTWGPVDMKMGEGGHGDLGTVALVERARLVDSKELGDHYVALATVQPGTPIVSYVGAGWTGSRDFEGVEDWWVYIDAFAQRLETPVKVTLIRETGPGR
jgi:pectinesterase